jgi:biotin carboxylase
VDASNAAMCRSSSAAASFRRVPDPWADPDGYVEAVARACYDTGAAVLLPGHEDMLLFASMRDRLPERTALLAGGATLLEEVSDKERLVSLAEAAGVPVPATRRPTGRDDVSAMAGELGYPMVVKPRVGNSAKGVALVHNERACVRAFDETVRRYGLADDRLPILQESVPGDGVGVALLYDRGECIASFAERYLRCKNGMLGTSVFRESIEAAEVVAAARRLMDHLQWHGLAHLDFLHDPATGRLALIEVNPRLWGALDLAVRSGVDFPRLYVQRALGQSTEPVHEWKTGVRSRWILGEAMNLVTHLRHLRPLGFLGSAWSQLTQRAHGHDDLRSGDVRSLFTEARYYGTRFLGTGSLNPVEEGMVR